MSWEALIPYATWLGNTPFALWLGMSTWRIAGLLTVHLFGLTTLLGSVVVASLRLLGLFQAHKPIAELRREVAPAMLVGLVLMVGSGLLIFTGGAQAYYEGYWFRLKMVLLAITLAFHFTVFRLVTRADEGRFPRVVQRLTGLATLVLWFGVGWAGRSIAFF
jgi:uncharacterized membrane protein SirB2